VVREGETLAAIAAEVYGDPRLWTALAEANDIDRPRFVTPGTALQVPAL
jgi:nucleoid-associated protein YgaU